MAPRSSSTQRRVFVDRQSSHKYKLTARAWRAYAFYAFMGALTAGAAYLSGVVDGEEGVIEREVSEIKEDGDTDSTDK